MALSELHVEEVLKFTIIRSFREEESNFLLSFELNWTSIRDLAEKIQRNHRSAYEPIKDERSAQSFKEIERDEESHMKARLAHLQAAVEELRRENISLRNWLGSLK